MGHCWDVNKITKVDNDLIRLDYCNHNGYSLFKIDIKKDDKSFKENFKSGAMVATNCHECWYDEKQEGDWFKIINKEIFDYVMKNDKFPEAGVTMTHSYDFENDKWDIPEDEVCVIPVK